MPKVSIIIPAYNEEKRIGKTLKEYSEYFNKVYKDKKMDYEILVVINNTRDNTKNIVENHKKINNKIHYLDLKKGGKGYAVIEGFKNSIKRNNDFIGFVDADLATSPEEFYNLVRNFDNCDGVIASRGMKNSKVKATTYRKFTNRAFNLLVRIVLFLPYKDTQCGAKVFKKEIIENLVKHNIQTQWAFDVDLLYRMKNKRIREFPTVWEDKEGSKINMKTPLKMFSSIMRLRLMYSPFNFVIRFYDSLPEKLKIHNL